MIIIMTNMIKWSGKNFDTKNEWKILFIKYNFIQLRVKIIPK